ncbi:carboxylic ester hydrolase [Cohnella abietis]|uniref:Carboxylic ester hydrolase n=1 Tax=Cohnella abietis TaxID=2507935 RepID=A0A3T1D697_9BACL|nr:carboxylic ester hydrolase [Cohnella abietis]
MVIFTIGLTVVLSLGTGASLYVFPQFSLVNPSGSHGIGELSLTLEDTSREEAYTIAAGDSRKIMLQIWYPTVKDTSSKKEHYPYEVGDALNSVLHLPQSLFSYFKGIPTHIVHAAPLEPTNSKYPLILFSPGNGSTRFQNLSLVEELVSNGYVVVGMDHPYTSSDMTYPDGTVAVRSEGKLESVSEDDLYEMEIDIRAKDMEFVIGQLRSKADSVANIQNILQEIDVNNIGVVGHSYGGATISQVMADDQNIKAGISYDGGLWGSPVTKGIRQPFLYMSASKTLDYLKSSDDNNKKFVKSVLQNLDKTEQASGKDFYFARFEGYNHYSFTDVPFIVPVFSNGHDTTQMTNEVSLAFFDQFLKGEKRDFRKLLIPDNKASLISVNDVWK